MPSPGGQVSEMASDKDCCGWGRVSGVWHLVDLAPARPHGSPGAELDEARIGFVKGCPRAAVWSGWRQVDEMPHSPSTQIIGDPVVP